MPPGAMPPGIPMPNMMPPMMPPPMYYPPPQQGPGFIRSVMTTIFVTIFLGSISLNVYLLLFSGLMSLGKETSSSEVIVEGDPKEQVAVIPVRGVITSKTSEKFDKLMKRIEADSTVKALVIDVDTPGGEVTASDQIYRRIMDFKEAKKLPVVVKQGSMATSGGYYISVAADYIFAEPTSITANIGVLLQKYNFSELADRWGIKETTTVSSGSAFKNAGSPFHPETQAEQQYWQTLVDQMYGKFKSVVQQGRKEQLQISIDQAADGRALTAQQAKDAGLVDYIGYAQDAYAKAASRAQLKKMHVVRYQETPTLFDVLGGAESKASGSTVNMNGVNVNFDASLLNDLSTPKVLYLWRGR